MQQPSNDRSNAHVTRRMFLGSGAALAAASGAAAVPRVVQATETPSDIKATTQPAIPSACPPFAASGVVPRIGVSAGLSGPRSEAGIGAVMAWGDRLWFISYTSHTATTGSGTGLYWVDESMSVHRHPASVVGTYANRYVHAESEQMIIGPHIIDADNNVRTIKELVDYRLTATMAHLHDRKNKVYMLGMESHFFEVDVRTLAVKLLFTLDELFKLPPGYRPHYKGGFTAGDRVIVGNNTYFERDETEGVSTGGRLAEWFGKGDWRIIENTAFTDIAGIPMGDHANAFAVGWDRASALLCVLHRGQWTRYRLPKASHCYDHAWYTEWPRIREVETERFLVDMHGMFYELPRQAYGGHVWGIKPVCQHLRMVPDFCSWKGFFVLAGNQNTACTGSYLVGEPQSNLWFGKTDDLWGFGKPQGWGGPWQETTVKAGEPSDPYLMTGFEHKCLHLTHDAVEPVKFAIDVDFLGNGTWRPYADVTVRANGYEHHVFPAGFGAHWVRLVADKACSATAQFVYT